MKKIGVIFPGVGAQYVGMGNYILENFKPAKKIVHTVSEILNEDLEDEIQNGTLFQLSRPSIAQPAILTISYLWFLFLRDKLNFKPIILAGHSLGEYTALLSSGAINLNDVIKLVKMRGKFIERVPGATTLVEKSTYLEVKSVVESCKNKVYFSCINSKTQFMLSSSEIGIEEFESKLADRKIMYTHFYKSSPIHSLYLKPLIKPFAQLLDEIDIHSMKVPVIGNTFGHVIENDPLKIREELKQQLVMTVLWMDSLTTLDNSNIDLIVATGPSTVHKKLCEENDVVKRVYSTDEIKDLNQMKKLSTKLVN